MKLNLFELLSILNRSVSRGLFFALLTLLSFYFASCEEEGCDSVTTANAGVDQNAIGTSLILNANTPSVGMGKWSIVSGVDGNLADESDPVTTFTGIIGKTYVLRWTITGCDEKFDEVEVSFSCEQVTPANAGTDQIVINSIATLNANTPVVGTGTWSIVSGSGGHLTNASKPTTTFTGAFDTAYKLRWTIAGEGDCSAQDEVDVVLLSRISKVYINDVLDGQYYYDTNGKVLSYVSTGYTESFVYAQDGKLSILKYVDIDDNSSQLKHFYHANGNLAYTSFESAGFEQTNVYTFLNGRVSQIVKSTQGVQGDKDTYEYTPDGYIIRTFTDPPNYSNPPLYTYTIRFNTEYLHPDPLSIISSIEYYLPWSLIKSSTYSGASFTYEFDNLNRVTKKVVTYSTYSPATYRYEYY